MNKLPVSPLINLGDRPDSRYRKMIEATFKEPTQSYTGIFKDWAPGKSSLPVL